MALLTVLLVLLSLSLIIENCLTYRPVIIMHGIFASDSDMNTLVDMIKTAYPGIEVTDISDYNNARSIEKMWDQVKGVYSKMKPVMDAAENGVNLVCYSQGGLVCRGILENFEHNVHTFISLSSPHAGQFGDTDFYKKFPKYTRDNIYLFFYTDLGQEISFANYWNDPYHQKQYFEHCNFLPLLNNGSSPQFKTNFLKLQQLVLIGGLDDGAITPWQSSHFGFYKVNSASEVDPLPSQQFYVNDSFGLKTLASAGKVKMYEIPGVKHEHWHNNQSVFDCCIKQWLDN